MRNGLSDSWRRLRSLFDAQAGAGTDAQLLARFIADRDEAAFAELVRRHGPLVYGVCRRILGNPHDADDAYQATFLILSRKPSSVRKVESLSCWLHGVALRVAVRLKRNISRRKDRAPLAGDVPESEHDDVTWREVQRLLDEELARLPEQFRQPLILCYLEGKTRDEAADELGWSSSTFRGRLERARERLRWRLERRGLTLSAALLATLAVNRSEAAPFSLTKASVSATTLAAEVLRTMLMAKIKTVLVWCVAVLFVSVGVGATAYRCVAVEPGEPRETSAPPKATKPTAEPAKPPTTPEEDGVVKDFKAHLDQFRLTITLRPQGLDNLDERYPVSDLRLRVWNGPIAEPGGKGTVFAQITKEQAVKIIDVLARDNFFRDSVADWERLKPPNGDYIVFDASYRISDGPQRFQRMHALDWDLHMVQQLEAIRQCVDGEAAKHLDTMLKSLHDDPRKVDKSNLLTIQSVDDLDMLTVLLPPSDQQNQFARENRWPPAMLRAEFDTVRNDLDRKFPDVLRQVKDGPVNAKDIAAIQNSLKKMQDILKELINDTRPNEYILAKRHLSNLEAWASALASPEKATYFLDGLLPFRAWPKDLTDEQKKLRDDGLKRAQTWLVKQAVEFRATRSPRIGDALRYTTGPTKIAQEWKGQMPAELLEANAFHLNVLLIQEGCSPFVHPPLSRWDKKTLACYQSAEQYAKLHKKGIWSDPKFAERLKKIAEKWLAETSAANNRDEIQSAVIEELLQKDAIVAHLLDEKAKIEQDFVRFRELLVNPEKNAEYQRLQRRLEEIQQKLAARRAELMPKILEEVVRRDPRIVALENEIQELEKKLAEWVARAPEPEKLAGYQNVQQALLTAQSELLRLRVELHHRLQK